MSDAADIPAARDSLETWLHTKAPQLGDNRRYEIVLAANELLVNAFEHGDEGGCLLDMRCVRDELALDHLTLTVTNNAHETGVLATRGWAMPEASARSGRGLAIVKSVADEVTRRVTATTVSISARFDLLHKAHFRAAREATLAL